MGKPRHRLRFWAMAACLVVFTLLGLVFIVVGPDSDTRLTGLMCVLLYLIAGGGVLLACAVVVGLFFLLAPLDRRRARAHAVA